MKKRVLFLFIFALMLSFTLSASAETYKVALLKIPTAEGWKQLIKEIGKTTNNDFKIELYPPARAQKMIEDNEVDVQAPRIKSNNAAYIKTLKYDFITTGTGNTVAFVLYTNKNKPLDINDLKNGNKKGYKIETDGANLKAFGFDAIFSNNAEQSLKKVDAGRIDGYIISQNTGDGTLKVWELKNIHRQLWANFESSMAIQKGQAGGKLDKILSEGMAKLKANGKLQMYLGGSTIYNDWQQ